MKSNRQLSRRVNLRAENCAGDSGKCSENFDALFFTLFYGAIFAIFINKIKLL